MKNFQSENPTTDGMTFPHLKAAMNSHYAIEIRTIVNFFRRQLAAYETRGGNKRKVIALP